MKKILIPIDFSEASEQAVSYAISWTEKWPVEIRLIHVVYYPVPERAIPSYGMYTPVTSTQAAQEELEQEARARMKSFVESIQEKVQTRQQPVELEGITLVGEPVNEVVEFVGTYRPDLMVIGVKQRNLLGRILWGTSAPTFVAKTPVPILTIPEQESFKGIHRVAYASNFDPSDKEVFTRMFHYLAEDNPTFYCVHMVDHQDNIVINEQLDYMKDMLKAHIEETGTKANLEYEVLVADDLVNSLEEFVAKESIDLIVLGTHKRKLLGKLLNPSQTKKILLHISKPLLIFHM